MKASQAPVNPELGCPGTAPANMQKMRGSLPPSRPPILWLSDLEWTDHTMPATLERGPQTGNMPGACWHQGEQDLPIFRPLLSPPINRAPVLHDSREHHSHQGPNEWRPLELCSAQP